MQKSSGSKRPVFQKFRFIFFTSAGILILIFAIAFSINAYIKSLNHYFDVEQTESVVAINSRIALHVNDLFDWNYSTLQTAAMSLKDIALDSPAFSKIIKLNAREYHFEHILFISSDGKTKIPSGEILDLSDRKYFQQAMTGVRAIPESIVARDNGNEFLVFALPLRNEAGKIRGVLAGYKNKNALTKLFKHQFDITHKDHQSRNTAFSSVLDINESRYVIEPELNIGDYIGNTDIFVKRLSLLLSQFKGTKNENHGTNIERAKAGKSLNYYDDLSEDDLLENLQVTKNLTVYSAYTKLKIDDWYIITFLIPETHAIENDTNAIVFISLCVIALFILLTFLIYGSYVQVKLYKQIQNFVLQDSVTEGGNGDWFNVEAAKLIGISKTATRALVILDIDRFKIITDKFGHEQGNLTLRRIYDCICSILDPGEIVSRIEGDTFAMLMKYHKPETIRERMELLSMKINDPKQNKNKYVIYFSCGVCQITESNPDMMVLRDHALIGLYSCKNSQTGAVKVGFFNEVEHRKLLREKEIENRMGLALESKEFMVYLQPKYDIRQNRIAGAEALARWNDKDNGILMPSEFIPLFERNGFILSLDLFVFEQVCSTLRKWIDAGIEPVIISTNLSRTYLNDEAFLTKIDEIRERYDVPAKYIELEITESVVLENMNWLIEVINKIRARGFSCSLDDFGSGYSSLNVLKNLPIDVLKLDRKFFTNSENDPDRGNVIIASVIDLAKKLNIKTVSEGVEKTPQLEFLKDAQCDMVQSYIYSKPITISEFELIAYGKVIEKK